ncbi:hypothetical protein D3C81_1587580 [compost metagenome]
MVGIVVPGRRTDTRTEISPVGKIELTQQIDTICHKIALVELAVGLVIVRVVHDLAVLLFCADAQVVAQRVVPAHPNVRVANIDFHRRRTACAAHERQRDATAQD